MTKIFGEGAEGRPAIAYVRVSTAAQGESGISLSTQKAVISASSEAWGYSVVEVFTDVASATGPNNMAKRFGLQGALRAAENYGAVLIVSDWTRLTRHERDLESITAVVPAERILSVDDTENLAKGARAGRIARSEEMGRRISERTKQGMAKNKKSSGARYGNPNIHSVQVSGAAAARAKKEKLWSTVADVLSDLGWPDAKVTNQALAKELNVRGIKTGQGKNFNEQRVKNVRRGAEDVLLKKAPSRPDVARTTADEDGDQGWQKPAIWGRF